jgi:uncharacterized protein (UPF0335 family)
VSQNDKIDVAGDHLRQFIERIERLEDEKATISEDIKEVFKEAKSSGFDVKTMREIIRLRGRDQGDIEESEFLLTTYKRAMGMEPELDFDAEKFS